MATNHEQEHRPGVAVDAKGGAVVDPTSNVLQLVEAAVDRQDDLRDAFEKYVNVRLECVKDIERLRAEHAKELGVAEAKRLDAVRLFDVAAAKTESERALAAIQILATQTATDRETLRAAVANTAQTIAKQTADDRAQLSERIAALEKSSYEGKGKQALSDPAMALMVEKLDKLGTAMTTSKGRGEGMDKMWAIIVGLLGAGGGGVLVFLGTHWGK